MISNADVQRARKLAKKTKLKPDEDAELKRIYALAARQPVGTRALERIADGNTCNAVGDFPGCSHDYERHPAHTGPCKVYVPYAMDGWYCPCGGTSRTPKPTRWERLKSKLYLFGGDPRSRDKMNEA